MKKFTVAWIILLTALFLPRLDAAQLGNEVVVLQIQIDRERELRTVVIGLYDQAAPQTVENFKKLARRNFYKGMEVHRVFPGTLVQTGDPLSRKRDKSRVGTGGPGYTLPLEAGLKHLPGRVAMARLPDDINPAQRSNGSQFYFVLTPMPNLDGDYTVFGEVLEGMETLEEISEISSNPNHYPVKRVRIRSSRLMPRTGAVD